jgi:DNA-binding NtrC family response regulator
LDDRVRVVNQCAFDGLLLQNEMDERMTGYSWPGNVRELENAVEHACVMAKSDVIEIEDLPSHVRRERGRVTGAPLRPLKEIERDHIQMALVSNRFNKTLTAQQLGISAATLFRKLKKYGENVAAENDTA